MHRMCNHISCERRTTPLVVDIDDPALHHYRIVDSKLITSTVIHVVIQLESHSVLTRSLLTARFKMLGYFQNSVVRPCLV